MLPVFLFFALAWATRNSCIPPHAIPNITGSEIRNIGMVLFPTFDMIDVFGTLDPLQLLSLQVQKLNLHLIAVTLDPVTTQPVTMNQFNSSFFPTIQPTATFDDDLDLDILIVPGGPGARSPSLSDVYSYIAKTVPKVKLLMTVCTGAGIAASAGVLDGYMATTNKHAWSTMTAMGPNVTWVAPARYVVDGDVWTSSGVTSTLDLVYVLIKTFWGEDAADTIYGMIEHTPLAESDDPFTAYYNITPTVAQPCPYVKQGHQPCKL